MKKTKSIGLLISIIMLMLLVFINAIAAEEVETFEYEHYKYWTKEDGTICIYFDATKEKAIEIPAVIEERKVTELGEGAFMLSQVKEISIPDSITTIEGNPFTGASLEKIIVAPESEKYTTIDDILFDKTTKKLICYPANKEVSVYEVPNGINIIGKEAFFTSFKLEKVIIPDSVTILEDSCFAMNRSVKEITLSQNLKEIPEKAFFRCDKLEKIELPATIETINASAFSGCTSLFTLKIPSNVTSISDKAFENCPSLTLTVDRDSYAAEYAKENGLNYQYSDALDWLNN